MNPTAGGPRQTPEEAPTRASAPTPAPRPTQTAPPTPPPRQERERPPEPRKPRVIPQWREHPIQVRFNGQNGAIVKLPAREAVLERSLGSAVRWTFHLFVPMESEDRQELSDLAQALGAGRVQATAYYSSHIGVFEFGLPALVTGCWWDDRSHHLVVQAQNTGILEEKPNALVPRWRVHHVDDLWRVTQKFGYLVRLPDATIKNALSQVRFADADRANVIQAGVSDWEYLAMILWQYRLLGDASLQPMVLSGSVNGDTEGNWVFTWGSKKACEAAGQVAQRTIRFADADGYERPMFFAGEEVRSEHLLLPHASIPGGGILRHRRPFTHDNWTGWRSKDVPLFTQDGKMVWRVVDRLYDTGSKRVLGWSSKLEFLPPESTVHQEFPPRLFQPWIAAGKVKQNFRKGPWLEVELADYEKDLKENLVYARLKTIHSGLQGKAGLQLQPEVGTDVMVEWSGRFDESVIYGDNFRARKVEAQHAHPSCWIESPAIEEHANIHIRSVGQTVIESDWKTRIEKETQFESVALMRFLGNGVKSDHLDEYQVLKASMPPNQHQALRNAAADGVPFCKRCMGLE